MADKIDDKYILLGMGDERSKHVAEVLGNKTCKKILDFLSERKEASEKDIADGLGIPLNTVEYNLNKLKKSGLVVSSKNFFWSRKGKKIPMYKLAEKHIIISPSKKPSLTALKAILPILIVLFAALIVIALLWPRPVGPGPTPGDNVSLVEEGKLRNFDSQDELNEFIKENSEAGDFFGWGLAKGIRTTGIPAAAVAESADSGAGGAGDYSTTNIQVEGVDEADIVKNDGKYIYVVSGNKIVIVEAYPVEGMEVLSEIDPNRSVSQIFINDDKLITFASGYEYVPYMEDCVGVRCGGYSKSSSYVYIYDISDRKNPELENEIEIEGNYVNSRMIGDYVYVIASKYVYADNPVPPVYIVDGIETKVAASDVYYWDYPDTNYVFTSIAAIDVKNGETNTEVYLTGYTGEIYVSQNNIFLTYQKRMSYEEKFERIVEEVYYEILPAEEYDKIKKIMESSEPYYTKMSKVQEVVRDYSDSLKESKGDFDKILMEKLEEFNLKIAKEEEKTIIHKININKNEIVYKGVGEAPGHILNQFSMDEHNGYFRIATTTGNFWQGSSMNNLYILNPDLEIVGKVEDLAKGEKIYSTRFMGDRAYIVTFKKVDPLFVIDVSNPEAPEVLGYLKITGYSDYLHPYDENHIIGIGKETVAASSEDVESRSLDFAWYQGVKISLFDVSDVNNPIEKAKIEIGDRGTSSDALYDHKAVLFDKEKEILVIPISLSEMDEDKLREQYGDSIPDWATGERVWEGAYVLNINTEEISVRGMITHNNETDIEKEYSYTYFPYQNKITRSLYMDDVLYTISQAKIKANDLETIEELNKVDLGYEGNYYMYDYAI